MESTSGAKKKRLSPSSVSQIQILNALAPVSAGAVAEPRRLDINEIAERSGLRDEKETQRFLFIRADTTAHLQRYDQLGHRASFYLPAAVTIDIVEDRCSTYAPAIVLGHAALRTQSTQAYRSPTTQRAEARCQRGAPAFAPRRSRLRR
jgi:hypothetical protein